MSDLQCPATFLLLPVDVPAADDQPFDPRLGPALGPEHVAAVYARSAGGDPRGARAADELARALGTRRGSLDDVDVAALEELADLHRGERVVVLLAADELTALLQVARRGAEGAPTPGWTEVAVDADGWLLRAAP